MQLTSAQPMSQAVIAPAYQVLHHHPGIEFTTRLFTHPRLLSARKEAISYVEHLLAELWLRGDLQTVIEVRLLTDSTSPDSPPMAVVYRLDIDRQRSISLKEEQTECIAAIEQLHQEWSFYWSNQLSMGLGFFRSQINHPDYPDTYCQLYDAGSYFTQLSGQLNAYPLSISEPEITVTSTYEDRHYDAHQIHDALV